MSGFDPILLVAAAAAAFVVALLSSVAGVTGAFLLVPLQVALLGQAGPSVSATNHLYNVFAAPGGILGYRRQGRLFAPLAWLLLAGTVPGIVAGVVVRVRWLPDAATFLPFAGAVLLALAVLLLARLPRSTAGRCDAVGSDLELQSLGPLRLAFRYAGRTHSISVPGLLAMSAAVGLAGGAYGVGGGAFLSSYLIAVCRVPVYATAGATMAATFGASLLAATVFWAAGALGFPGAAPRLPLALALGVGGMAGAALGSRLQRRVPQRIICLGLAAAITWIGLRWALGG